MTTEEREAVDVICNILEKALALKPSYNRYTLTIDVKWKEHNNAGHPVTRPDVEIHFYPQNDRY